MDVFEGKKGIRAGVLIVAVGVCLMVAGAVQGQGVGHEADAGIWTAHVLETISLSEPLPSWGGMGGVSVDAQGYVYIANFGAEVWKIHEASGEVELLSDGLYGASGNMITTDGDLLQAEFDANRIRRIDRLGEVHTFADAGLSGPVGLSYGAGGDVFVANCLAGNIARIPAGGGAADVFIEDERFQCPNGITADRDGTLYVVNNTDTRVFSITTDGHVAELAHLPGVGHGHVVFARGALYVTQLWNHRIVRLELDGTFRSVAGDGRPGRMDGTEARSSIKHPNGLAVSRGGSTLYFNTVRGPMLLGTRADLELRRLRLPTPFRNFRSAWEEGGVEELKRVFEWYDGQLDEAPFVAHAQQAGFMFLQEDRVEPGLALYEWTAEAHGSHAPALSGYAQALAHYGDRARARQLYRRALELMPDDPSLRKQLEDLGGGG